MAAEAVGNYWLRSGAYALARNLSGMLLSLGTFYLLVRLLSKDEFGAWTLFLSTTTLLEVSRNGLVCNGLIKYAAGAGEVDYPKVVTASAVLMGGLTLICIVLILVAAPGLCWMWKVPELLPIFWGYTLVFAGTGVVNHLNSVQQARLNFRGSFLSSLAGSLIGFSYAVGGWIGWWEVGLIGLLWVQFAAVGAALLVSVVNTRPILQFSRKVDKAWLRSLFGYGKFSLGTMVSAMVFSSIDGWMLGALVAPAAAGAYSIATRILTLVEVPTNTVATIVFPQSAKRMENEGKASIAYLYEKSVGTILALLLPALLALFLFSGVAVRLLAGDQYADSIPILQVTLLYALLIPYGRQFGTIMDSIGKPDTNFKLVLFAAALNVGTNFLLIPPYGPLGAAIGTLAANGVSFIIAQIILKKHLGIHLRHTLVYALRFYPEVLNKYVRPRLATRRSLAQTDT